jgi:dTDP-4-dehydrorhamnose reductase
MKNILLIGKGYIGSYMAKGFKIQFDHISKKDIDYTNPNILEDYLNGKGYDAIINTTGYTGKPNVDACENDKENCYHYNVTVPLYLTKTANKLNIPIIHIGSGCVYTGYEKDYTEEDPTNFGADSFTSSFYSKTKDAFEKLSSNMQRYIFRIRIPFNGTNEPKNYLYKLLNYNDLISCKNSITNVDELVAFTEQFVKKIMLTDNKPAPGLYNVVNNGAIEAKEVVEIMKKYNLNNPNWKFVEIKDANFKVGRSNCILDTTKIKKIGLGLSDVYKSIETSIADFAKQS